MWGLWVGLALCEPSAATDVDEGSADDLPWDRLGELRERVSASRAQLDVLRAMYPDMLGHGATLVIEPDQRLGPRYDLVHTTISVDGQVVHTGAGSWQGDVSAGTHLVQLHATVRGANRGVFTYLNSYEIEVTSTQQIDVVAGERTVTRPVAVARPGFAYSFAERPAWWWEVEPDATR